MKKILSTLLIVTCTINIYAQDMFNAIRYNQSNMFINARSMAVGNSFGALGANSISTLINPAGLALYRSNEFTFSGIFDYSGVESQYLQKNNLEERFGFNINNLSLTSIQNIKQFGQEVKDGWRSYSFNVSLNRTNSFNRNMLFAGVNTNNSINDRFAEDMSRVYFNNLPYDYSSYGYMAYEAYLIEPNYEIDENNDTLVTGFRPYINPNERNIEQRQSLKSRGSAYDLNIAFAGNYSDKIFIGATMGLPVLNYSETTSYQEFNNNPSDSFKSLALNQKLNENGVGIYLAAGIIVKPIRFLRLGLSIKSPTFYSMKRDFTTTLSTETEFGNYKIEPATVSNSYTQRTAMQATFSAAVIIKKNSFISVDYNINNASKFYYGSSNSNLDYFDINQDIKNGLKATQQLRIGAEYMYTNLAFRLGYIYTSSPVENGYVPSNDMYINNAISGGIGYRINNFYLDVAYQQSQYSSYFQPYGLSYQEVEGANSTTTNGNFMVTAGFTF